MDTRSHDSNLPLLPALGRLICYRKALELARLVNQLPITASLRDQLTRAAESLVLNIAEGVGESGTASKRRYFTIARGSLYEMSAALDLLALRTDLGDRSHIVALAQELERILTTLVLRR